MSLRKYFAKLGKVSSYFFFSGFVLSKAQYLALPGVASILMLAAVSSNLTGYLLWLIATFFYPEHKKLNNKWFAFNDFSEQHQKAAILGAVATAIGLAAVFFPVLFIPATWLIFASNILWSTSEYHKLKNPPPSDEPFSESFQSNYVTYAVTMSSIALVTALGTTLAIVFSPVAIYIFLAMTILSLGLGIVAADYWITCNFGIHEPTVHKNSYNHLTTSLGPKTQAEPDAPIPHHGTALHKDKPCNEKTALIESPLSESSIACNIQ